MFTILNEIHLEIFYQRYDLRLILLHLSNQKDQKNKKKQKNTSPLEPVELLSCGS